MTGKRRKRLFVGKFASDILSSPRRYTRDFLVSAIVGQGAGIILVLADVRGGDCGPMPCAAWSHLLPIFPR